MKKTAWLWIAGVTSAALVAITIIGYVFRVEIIREELKTQAANDPFAGFAGGMAELTAEAMRLDWGIGILIIGTTLIIAAAAFPAGISGTRRLPQSQPKPAGVERAVHKASETKPQDIAGLLDKMKKGVYKGVALASAKSKEMLETTRIKRHITSLIERKDADLEGLGKTVFRMYRENRFEKETIEEKCRILAGIDKQIEEQEEELRRVQMQAANTPRTIACENSGQCACGARIAEEAQFCVKCGAKVR
jgi:hypothetical protein